MSKYSPSGEFKHDMLDKRSHSTAVGLLEEQVSKRRPAPLSVNAFFVRELTVEGGMTRRIVAYGGVQCRGATVSG
jgi:hypothetical protein